MNWDLDLVRMGERLKEKEIRLLRLRRPIAGAQAGKNHNMYWSFVKIKYLCNKVVWRGTESSDANTWQKITVKDQEIWQMKQFYYSFYVALFNRLLLFLNHCFDWLLEKIHIYTLKWSCPSEHWAFYK